MLVLSRKRGQSITIGDTTITILRTASGSARVGVDAPPELDIRRTELPPLRPDSGAAACPITTDALPLGQYLPHAG
jgi:carbon storage regulator CsrA